MKIKSNFKKLSSRKGFTRYHTAPGFTLIELLIVIVILGILAAGILVAIDPIDKIRQANDSKVQNDVSAMGRASEAYATLHNGFYPYSLAGLEATGELKIVLKAPSGYDPYELKKQPLDSCVSDCTSIIITGQLKSKRFNDTPFWRYESSTGKGCEVALRTDTCP